MNNFDISYNDIINYPEIYLKKLIDENNSNLLYQYGPYLIMNVNNIERYSKYVTFINKPELKTLIELANLYNRLNGDHTVSDIKKYLTKKMIDVSSMEYNHYTDYLKGVYKENLDKLKEIQYSDKLLESALINYAPIVTYSKIIKKPGMEDDISDINKTNTDMIKYINSVLSTPDKVFEKITHLFNIDPFQLLINHDKTIPFNKSEDKICKYNHKLIELVRLGNKNIVKPWIVSYYILVYIYFNFPRECYDDIINTLLFPVTTNDTEIVSFSDAMEYMLKFDIPEESKSVLSSENEKNMQYEQDKEIEEIMEKAKKLKKSGDKSRYQTNDDIPEYKLEEILAFIYTNPRYTADTYSNSLFLNKNLADGYSHIDIQGKTFLLYEYKNRYLCIPIVDMSDNNKLKVIRLDKSDNIEVIDLTEIN